MADGNDPVTVRPIAPRPASLQGLPVSEDPGADVSGALPLRPLSAPVERDAFRARDPLASSNLRALVSGPGVTITDYRLQQPTAPRIGAIPTGTISNEVRGLTGDVSHELTAARRSVVGFGDDLLRGRARLDAVTPAATRVGEAVGAVDRAIIRGTPTGVTSGMRSAISGLSRTLGSVVPQDANYTRSLPYPVYYDDGRGTRLVVPAGSRVVARDGNLRLQSPGAFLQANGTTVRVGSLDLNIGSQQQSAIMSRFRVDTASTTVDLQGLQTRLGTDGSFLMRAESAAIDLRRSQTSIRLRGAEFSSTSPDAMRAGWDALAVQTRGVTVTTGRAGLTASTEGSVNRLSADVINARVDSAHTTFRADSMNLTLQRDARTGAGSLGWTANGVRYNDGRNSFNANVAAMDFVRRPDGTSAFALRGRDVNLDMGDRSWQAAGTSSFQINYDARGQLTNVVAEGDSVRFNDRTTNFAATGATLQASFNDEGLVTRISGGAREFNLQTSGTALTVQQGALDITRDGNAVRFHGTALSGSYVNRHGTYELGNNGTLDMRVDGTRTTLQGTAGAFSFADGRGRLDLTNGRIDASFGPDGDSLRFNGDQVRYRGTDGNKLASLDVDGATVDVRRGADGAMNLGMAGSNFGMTLDGHRVTVANADHVNIATDTTGAISNIDMLLPGRSTFVSRDGNVDIGVTGLDARYTRNATGEALRIGFQQGSVDIRSLGLVANATGLRAGFQVDPQGRLTNAGLDVSTLDARYRGTSIRVNNQEGESLSLRTRFNEGVFSDAVLRIPQQGEVLVATNDVNARIGQGVYRLSYDQADGSFRMRAQDFQASGTFQGVTVRTNGENFDASLVNGNLVLNNIRGTNVSVDVPKSDLRVNVDMQAVDNLLLRASGISGLATGAMITLTPTADNSRITANITANYAGVPISLRIDNARQLEALAMVQVNQARVMVRDPSGQGRLHLGAGPLTIDGQGTIGAVVDYRPYRASVFTESAFNMVGDYRLGEHLRLNPNGSASLYTAPDNPLFIGGTVMFPRTVNPYSQFETPPSTVRQPLVPTEAFGFVGTLGVQGVDSEGTRRALGVYAGVVPGSTVDVTFQGDARLAGVPLPNRMAIPTTVVGGVRFERENRDSSLAAIVGAQVNVAGLASSQYLQEPASIGGHVGVSYQRRELRIGDVRLEEPFVSGAATYTQGGGAGFRVGVGFKF